MKALLLCASHNDLGLIRSLRKIGYYIIAIGRVSDLIGEKYVDEYIRMDYSDKEAVLKLAKEKKIDAICQCCNDFGVYTAAYVAEKLGMQGYDSYETTLTLHNKDKFKKFAKENNIPTSQFCVFTNQEEARQASHEMQFPLIVKPVDASAGNGIHKAETEEELHQAIKEAFDNSVEGRIVVEEYLSGTQHGFCTFLKDRKVVAYCSNNEYSILNPYRVEIDTFPAENNEKVAGELIVQIEKIADKLELKDGIFHLQYIFKDGRAYILEVMRRILGNMYSVPASLLTGFDWDYWETRAKCGLSCDVPEGTRMEGFYAYKTILAPENGKIVSIQVPEKYNKFLMEKCMIKKIGDRITNYPSEPIGFLFFMFSSEDEMKKVLIEEYDNALVQMEK